LPLSLCQDTSVKADVYRFLTELQPTIRRLVVGDIVLPTWSPSDVFLEPETIAHLNSLKIPSLKGKPNLLLHDLGSFTRDVLLERRLRNIFMPNNHTFVNLILFFWKFYRVIFCSLIQLGFLSILPGPAKPGFYWKAFVRTGVSTLHPSLILAFLVRVMFRIVFKHMFPTLRTSAVSFLHQAPLAMKLL
jgi:hypothetical protein